MQGKHLRNVSTLYVAWSSLKPPDIFYHEISTSLLLNLFYMEMLILLLRDSEMLLHLLWK